MQELTYYLVDVFTNIQFGGNPLAVFPNAQGLTTEQMQKIAKELNLSETTFILPPQDAEHDCQVRIFTPAIELPMAGHPTVGTAFVLLTNQLIQPKNEGFFLFEEGVGAIKVNFNQNIHRELDITMEQPIPHFSSIYPDKHKIAALLSLDQLAILPDLPVQVVSCGVPVVIVPISTLTDIGQAKVRLDLLEEYLKEVETKVLFLFTTETVHETSTVHSRCFAPTFGITEDPATGGASGPLGSYLVKYAIASGESMISEQGFEMGRPSMVSIGIETDNQSITGVKVGGNCVAVGKGSMYLKVNVLSTAIDV